MVLSKKKNDYLIKILIIRVLTAISNYKKLKHSVFYFYLKIIYIIIINK